MELNYLHVFTILKKEMLGYRPYANLYGNTKGR